jgi:myosin-5
MMDLDHVSFLYNIFLLTKCTTTYLSLQEARETGALKEAKDKLEKKVEELTWRVQLEKRMRTDLEEAKAQELSKLQSSMEALQAKLDETSAKLVKEREVARAIEEAPPVVQQTEVLVQDTEKVDSLTAEVEELKVRMILG